MTMPSEADPSVMDTTPLLVNNASDYDSPEHQVSEENHETLDSKMIHKSPATNSNFVYYLTFLSAIGGFLFGYDTGVISGAMLLIREKFNLSSFWQELVVSATIGAAALFALVGGYVNNLFGRKPTILVASCVFTAGALMLGGCNSTGLLLAGRIVVGVGIGTCIIL